MGLTWWRDAGESSVNLDRTHRMEAGISPQLHRSLSQESLAGGLPGMLGRGFEDCPMRNSEAPTRLKRQVLDLVTHLLGEGSDSLGQPLDSTWQGRNEYITPWQSGDLGWHSSSRMKELSLLAPACKGEGDP